MPDYTLHPSAVLGPGATVGAGAVIEGACRIGTRAQIAAGAIVRAGIAIGAGAYIAPGSVVVGDVPALAVVRGNPAAVVDFGCESRSAASRLGTAAEVECDVAGVKLYRLPKIVDARGSLTFGELDGAIPFVTKRFFIVYDVPAGEPRGGHAHATCGELLLVLGGSVAIVVDDGRCREEIVIDAPDLALYLPPLVWGVQYKYSAGAALVVLASHRYDPADYIYGYDDFVARVGA